MRRRVREEQLVAALMSAKADNGGRLTHEEALAQLHSEIPDEVLADDESCLEALVAMDVSV